MSTILVTGGTGFVGGHTIVQLLAANHEVRSTVRNLERAKDVHAMLAVAGIPDPGDRLRFFAADLRSDSGWEEAVKGCEFVLHIASPFPTTTPKHEDELIVPAREGTLRVLRAARKAGVKRVVLTSSFVAVGYGHPKHNAQFDETFWTNVDADDVLPYTKSKTLAEHAAWEFVKQEGGGLELSVINPAGIFGPVLAADTSTSIQVVLRLLNGSLPGCPRICFGVVDVRDVVDLHLRAMTHEAACGERFLAIAGDFMWFVDVARLLKARMGNHGRKVSTWQLPDFVVRLAALADGGVKQLLPELGKPKNATNAKAKVRLGWSPRSNEESILATAESLVRLGLIK